MHCATCDFVIVALLKDRQEQAITMISRDAKLVTNNGHAKVVEARSNSGKKRQAQTGSYARVMS